MNSFVFIAMVWGSDAGLWAKFGLESPCPTLKVEALTGKSQQELELKMKSIERDMKVFLDLMCTKHGAFVDSLLDKMFGTISIHYLCQFPLNIPAELSRILASTILNTQKLKKTMVEKLHKIAQMRLNVDLLQSAIIARETAEQEELPPVRLHTARPSEVDLSGVE